MTWIGATAEAIAAAVAAGEASAREVVAEHLERARAADGHYGAFRALRAEAAMAEAEAVDMRGDRDRLPLAGVPVAVKDNTPVAGEATRSGSGATADRPAVRDHEVVRRLRAAGAVVLGLSAMPELGLLATGDSAFGITRNPWHPERTPGGSSSGSAAAVAAGMVAAGQANDALGSIRVPAACCGLVGVKPGPGLVPEPFGDDDPWFGLAENGPLARTVADAALVLAVLAARPSLARVEVPVRRLRVAVSTRPVAAGAPVDRDYRLAVEAAAEALARAGHDVVAADPPYPASLGVTVLLAWAACADGSARGLDARRLDRATRALARAGGAARRLGLVRPAAWERWRAQAGSYFSDVDVLLTPMLAAPPPPAARWGERGLARNAVAAGRFSPFAAPWNLARVPAAAVPAGVHPAGVPLSVQLVARPGGERLLLAAAGELERARPWPHLAPASALASALATTGRPGVRPGR